MNSNLRDELKSKFVSYWESLTLMTACKINLFDLIQEGNNTLESIQIKSNTNLQILNKVLNALVQLEYISLVNQSYALNAKGNLLTDSHPESLKYACIHWGEEHLTAWQNLSITLTTGKSSFEHLHGENYFSYISKDSQKLENYHRAMNEYAREDYKDISLIYNFKNHKSIMDVGSGTGFLGDLLVRETGIQGYMFDSLEVLNLVKNKTHIHKVAGNFLEYIPSLAEAILLARVLHDWNNEKAKLILQNCHTSLPDNGKLYVFEILKEQLLDKAVLLDLNMSVMCNSSERTFEEYYSLLSEAGFHFIEMKRINSLQYMQVWEKK